jgi:subtilase family serine protease
VTGVPDRYYLLEFCADLDSEIEEANETNNCSSNLIQLLHMGTPQKTVINLGPKK